jgi:hypothetical protein
MGRNEERVPTEGMVVNVPKKSPPLASLAMSLK